MTIPSPISTADVAASVAKEVSRSVSASLAQVLCAICEKERYLTREQYGRHYGIGHTKLQEMGEWLRKKGALTGKHKMQRYDKFFNPYTGKSIFELE
jgi:hypothetical protein